MQTHSGILAWRIPWTEEPGRLQSMGSQRVGYDRVTKLHLHACVGRLPLTGGFSDLLQGKVRKFFAHVPFLKSLQLENAL